MTDALSIGWSQDQARGAERLYRRVLGFNMLLHVATGLLCIFAPDFVSDTVGLAEPFPTGWVRSWGAMLMLVTALYVPGLLSPIRERLPNLIGIGGRFWMGSIWTACFLIGERGFLVFAIFDFVWALILAALYLRLFRGVIMSRP